MRTRKTATPDLLDDRLLRAMANCGGVRNGAANAVRVTEKDRPDSLLIQSGRVKAYGSAEDGRERVSRVFKPLTEGGYVQTRSGRIVLLKEPPARF